MLPGLLNLPIGDRALASWSFNHADEHIQIITTIHRRGGVALTQRILDPIANFDFKNWLWAHQQTHNEMNAVLGIQGANLSQLNFDDKDELDAWAQLHFVEHQEANFKLGI